MGVTTVIEAFGCALLAVLASGARAQGPASTIELRSGLVITRSVRVAPRAYRLAAPESLDSAVITIRGNDITVDFNGASLVGLDPSADPDQARGVGIRIDGGRNVRVINAVVRGYKVGLLARGTRNLTLARDDFGHNWKPRLFSVIERESLVDWLPGSSPDSETSGCVSVRAPTSRTSAAARSTTCASSRAWKA